MRRRAAQAWRMSWGAMFARAAARAVASSLLEKLHSHGGDGRTPAAHEVEGGWSELPSRDSECTRCLIFDFCTDFFLPVLSKKGIDQKLRLRNFDARNEKIKTGAVVTNRRGQPALKGKWENAINGKQDSCSFRHDANKRANSTPNPLLPVYHRQQSTGKYSEKQESQRLESILEVSLTTVQRLHQW